MLGFGVVPGLGRALLAGSTAGAVFALAAGSSIFGGSGPFSVITTSLVFSPSSLKTRTRWTLPSAPWISASPSLVGARAPSTSTEALSGMITRRTVRGVSAARALICTVAGAAAMAGGWAGLTSV